MASKIKNSPRRLSGFISIIIVSWVIGVCLVLAEATKHGFLLLAIGGVLMSTALVASMYKSHIAATMIRLLRRELISRSKTDNVIVESEDRSLTPEKAGKLPRKSSARIPRFRIAVIGTAGLQEYLSDRFELIYLYPGVSEAVCKVEKPHAFLIEEQAFYSGAWAGTLNGSTPHVYNELLVLVNNAAHDNIPIYIVPSEIVSSSTYFLRKRATSILDKAYICAYDAFPFDPSINAKGSQLLSSIVEYAR